MDTHKLKDEVKVAFNAADKFVKDEFKELETAADKFATHIKDAVTDVFRSKAELDDTYKVYKALAENKHKPDVWLPAATDALQKGQASHARLILETFLEGEPHNLPARLLLVKTCLWFGDAESIEEAIGVARQAYIDTLATADAGAQSVCAVSLAVTLGKRARLHTFPQLDRQQDRLEALQLLDRMSSSAPAASAPGPGVAGDLSSHASYLAAVLLAEEGRADEALQHVRGALSAADRQQNDLLRPLCVCLVALLLSARQQHATALSVLNSSTDAKDAGSTSNGGAAGPSSPNPASPAAPSSDSALLADVLCARVRARLTASAAQDPAKALALLAQCKRRLSAVLEGKAPMPHGATTRGLQDMLARVWEDLAVLFAESGQHAEALSCVDNARALQPWSPTALHALGQVYEAAGETARAIAAYDDALALEPHSYTTLMRLGALYRKRGSAVDLAVARDLLAEALRYSPNAPDAWFNLGMVAEALQHRAEAEEQLLTAMQLGALAPVMEYSCMPLLLPS